MFQRSWSLVKASAAALYRYAAEGDAGTFFSPDMVKGAFQRK